MKKRAHIPHNFEMSFGTNASGYHEHEMRRQGPVLIGVSLSQKTSQPVEKVSCRALWKEKQRKWNLLLATALLNLLLTFCELLHSILFPFMLDLHERTSHFCSCSNH